MEDHNSERPLNDSGRTCTGSRSDISKKIIAGIKAFSINYVTDSVGIFNMPVKKGSKLAVAPPAMMTSKIMRELFITFTNVKTIKSYWGGIKSRNKPVFLKLH